MTRMTEADVQSHLSRMQTWTGLKDDAPDQGTESKLQSKCEAELKRRGWEFFHDRSRGKNKAGLPDLVIFAPGGKVILVELKAKGGKMSDEQKLFRFNAGRNGHVVHEVRSFKRFLDLCEESKLSPTVKQARSL